MATPINYQGLDPATVLEYAERTLRVCGAPIRSGGVDLTDYDDLVAKYLAEEDFPSPLRLYRVMTLVEIEAAAVSLLAVVAAAAAKATSRTKAQAFVAGVAAVRGIIDALRDDASTLETFVYSTTSATFRTQVQSHMNALGAKLGTLMDALDLMVDGEEFLAKERVG